MSAKSAKNYQIVAKKKKNNKSHTHSSVFFQTGLSLAKDKAAAYSNKMFLAKIRFIFIKLKYTKECHQKSIFLRLKLEFFL